MSTVRPAQVEPRLIIEPSGAAAAAVGELTPGMRVIGLTSRPQVCFELMRIQGREDQ